MIEIKRLTEDDVGRRVIWEAVPGAGHPHSFFSMLTFCFEALQSGDHDKTYFVELYKCFRHRAPEFSLPDSVRIDFHLVPITVKAITHRGWALEIRLYGFGETEASARESWVRGFSRIQEVLLELERSNEISQ